MEGTSDFVFYLISIIASALIFLFLRHGLNWGSNRRRHPPGPPGWPIIGNLFDLGSMPHRSLADFRAKYGDVIWLRLGAINTMAILSSKAATDFFKNHDMEFAERNVTETMRVHGYDQGSLALAPYGSHWRALRRLVTVEMIVNKRINETISIRAKCVNKMLEWIEEEASKLEVGRGLHVARFVFLSTFNLLANLMLSRDLWDPESKDGLEFFTSMLGLQEWSGHANLADLFPSLKWLDPQGLKRKMKRDLGKALEIASEFVKLRVEENKKKEEGSGGDDVKKDFLDVLLEFEGSEKDEPTKISDRDLNIFILEVFLAGGETTSSSTEWAMTELLLNPESMTKAKAELNRVVGPNRKLEESDIENLPYLQAAVKENLRLHPPIPFLVPRKAMKDTTFMGYDIPKNTQVFVDVWAIGRDPDVWDDPLRFKPERFIGSKLDYKGQNYEYIPFGAGRRMCAGVPLAHRMLHLLLGSLIHQFEWELDSRVTPETLDMKDQMGVTVRKFEPLLAVPKKTTNVKKPQTMKDIVLLVSAGFVSSGDLIMPLLLHRRQSDDGALEDDAQETNRG